jgi:hypothetical protein
MSLQNPGLRVPLAERIRFARRRNLWIARLGEYVWIWRGRPRLRYGTTAGDGQAVSVWIGGNDLRVIPRAKAEWLFSRVGTCPRRLLVYRSRNGKFFARGKQDSVEVGRYGVADEGAIEFCRRGFEATVGFKCNQMWWNRNITIEIGARQ